MAQVTKKIGFLEVTPTMVRLSIASSATITTLLADPGGGQRIRILTVHAIGSAAGQGLVGESASSALSHGINYSNTENGRLEFLVGSDTTIATPLWWSPIGVAPAWTQLSLEYVLVVD